MPAIFINGNGRIISDVKKRNIQIQQTKMTAKKHMFKIKLQAPSPFFTNYYKPL